MKLFSPHQFRSGQICVTSAHGLAAELLDINGPEVLAPIFVRDPDLEREFAFTALRSRQDFPEMRQTTPSFLDCDGHLSVTFSNRHGGIALGAGGDGG